MPYIIRPAQITDAPAITSLLREVGYFAWINGQPSEAVCEVIRKHLSMCLADSSHSVYVAVSTAAGRDAVTQCNEGEPLDVYGYVAIHWLPYLLSQGPEGYVSELFIRPGMRGQGIGSALLNTAVEEARRRGCARMRLLNMRHRESYLRGYYKKHGWEEREDAATFQLSLFNNAL